VLGVLGTAWQTQGDAFAAVPKRTGFLVKESGTNGAGIGIVPADVVEDGGVLDGFRKRDGMFAPLPEQQPLQTSHTFGSNLRIWGNLAAVTAGCGGAFPLTVILWTARADNLMRW
jgi:hypothetical protein